MAEPNPLSGLLSGGTTGVPSAPPTDKEDENPLSGLISGRKKPVATTAPTPAPAPTTAPKPAKSVTITEIDGMPVEEFFKQQEAAFTPAKPPTGFPEDLRYQDAIAPRVGPQSFARQESAIDKYLKDLPENAPREVIQTQQNQPLQPGGMVPSGYQPSAFTEYVASPSAYVPQTKYESMIDTPPYAQLRASDIERAKILEAQGAGFFDPLRPRTIASDYGRQIEEFQRFKGSIGENLQTISQKSDSLTPEERQQAARYYQQQFSDVPEVGAYYAAAALGSIKQEDIPTITKSLEGSIERMNPAKSVFDVVKGIPVVEQVSEYAVRPVIGFQQGPQGELVEPAALTALRALNSPVALVAGTAEGIVSGLEGLAEGDTNFFSTVGNTIGRYVREGRGFSDAASQILGRVGANIDNAVSGTETGEMQQLLSTIGLLGGFAGDLLTGPDELVRLPAKGIAKVAGTAGKVIDTAINNPVVSQAARRSVGEAVSQETVDAAKKAIEEFTPTANIRAAEVPQNVAVERFVDDTKEVATYSIAAAIQPEAISTSKEVAAVEARNAAKVDQYNRELAEFPARQAEADAQWEKEVQQWAATRPPLEPLPPGVIETAGQRYVREMQGVPRKPILTPPEKPVLEPVPALPVFIETPGQRYARERIAATQGAPPRPNITPPVRPVLERVPEVQAIAETAEQQVARRLTNAIARVDNITPEEAAVKVPEVIQTLKTKGFLDGVAGTSDAEKVLAFLGDTKTSSGIVGRMGSLVSEARPIISRSGEYVDSQKALYDFLVRGSRLSRKQIIEDIDRNIVEFGEPLADALARQTARQNYLNAVVTGINKAKPGVAIFSNTTGLLTRGLIRVTPDTFAPFRTVKKVIERLKDKAVLPGGTRLDDLMPGMQISDVFARNINDVLRATLYSGPPIKAGKLSEIDYQNIFNWVLRSEIRKQPFWLSAKELADASTRLGSVGKEVVGYGGKLAANIRRSKLEQSAFAGGAGIPGKIIPGELRKSIITTAISAARQVFIPLEKELVVNPIMRSFISEVKNGWGNIFERFRVLQRQAKKSGLSEDQAFAKVILNASDPVEAEKAFDEYIKMIYGSTNEFIQAYRGRTTTKTMSGSSPKLSISRMVDAALDDTAANPLANEALIMAKVSYLEAIKKGDYSKALEQLYKVHAALAGKTLHQGLFGGIDIAGVLSRVDDVLVSPTERQALKATEKVDVRYSPQNFLDLVSANWSQLEQGKVFNEVISKYMMQHPDVFIMTGDLAKSWFRNWSDEVLDITRSASGRSDEAHQIISQAIKVLDSKDYVGLRSLIARTELKNIFAERFGIVGEKDILADLFKAIIRGADPLPLESLEAAIRRSIYQLDKASTKQDTLLRYLVRLKDPTDPRIISAEKRLSEYAGNTSYFGRNYIDTILGKQSDIQDIEKTRDLLDKALTIKKEQLNPTLLDELDRVVSTIKGESTKNQLISAAGIQDLSNSLQEMLLPTGNRVLSEAEQLAVADILKFSLDSAIDHAKKIKPGEVPLGDKALKTGFETLRLIANAARAGTLGGLWAPIIPYHMTNTLSAPFVALHNLGPSGFISGLKGFATLPILAKTNRIFPKRTAARILNAIYNTGDNSKALQDFIITPSGMKYSVDQLVKAISRGSVMKSQAGAELSRAMLQDFVAWSGRNGLMKKRSAPINFLITSYNPSRSNIWNQFADAVDTNFRINVFADAIDAGKSIDEATTLARTALFDYGSLSNFERNTVARFIWFYTFWSRNLLKTFENILSNPARLTAPFRMKQTIDRSQDLDYDPTYAQNNVFRQLIQDKEAGIRYSLVGPAIPQMQALTDLIDYSGLFAAMAGFGSEADITPGQAGQKAIATIVGKSRPLVRDFFSFASAAKTGQGFDFGRGKEMTPYLDPRYVWWLHNTGTWDTFTSHIPVEEVTIKDQNPAFGTYNSLQYRVKPGYESRYYAFTQSLLPLGIQRAAREYADIIAPPTGEGKLLPSDRPEARFRWPGWFEWAARSAGVVDAVETPTMQEALWISEKARTPKPK